ncbi:MAG TPA: hypothetical protein VGH66_06360, partial [Acidimicrobiales bacterium]
MSLLIADAPPVLPPPPLPPPPVAESPGGRARRIAITATLVAGPGIALGVALPLLWGRGVHLRDLVIGVIFYAVTGHGITIGYHRL